MHVIKNTTLHTKMTKKYQCAFIENGHSHLLLVWMQTAATFPKGSLTTGLPRWLSGKESACQCRRRRRHRFDPWVRKIPWRGNGNPLQYSCLENPMDRGAWQSIVHGVARVGHTVASEQVTGRKASGLQMEEIGCKCQTFFISLKQQEETN